MTGTNNLNDVDGTKLFLQHHNYKSEVAAQSSATEIISRWGFGRTNKRTTKLRCATTLMKI